MGLGHMGGRTFVPLPAFTMLLLRSILKLCTGHLMFGLAGALAVSCRHEPPIAPEPLPIVCDTINVTYAGTIVPLLEQHCLGCHSGATPSGDFDFGNWLTLNALADDGRLRSAVTHDPQGVAMPPDAPPLPPCEVRKFTLWIEAGAPDN